MQKMKWMAFFWKQMKFFNERCRSWHQHQHQHQHLMMCLMWVSRSNCHRRQGSLIWRIHCLRPVHFHRNHHWSRFWSTRRQKRNRKGKGKKKEDTETEWDSDGSEGEKEEGEMNGYICDLNTMSAYPSIARAILFVFLTSLLHPHQLLKGICIEHS